MPVLARLEHRRFVAERLLDGWLPYAVSASEVPSRLDLRAAISAAEYHTGTVRCFAGRGKGEGPLGNQGDVRARVNVEAMARKRPV